MLWLILCGLIKVENCVNLQRVAFMTGEGGLGRVMLANKTLYGNFSTHGKWYKFAPPSSHHTSTKKENEKPSWMLEPTLQLHNVRYLNMGQSSNLRHHFFISPKINIANCLWTDFFLMNLFWTYIIYFNTRFSATTKNRCFQSLPGILPKAGSKIKVWNL